ncbi:hypothetical protein AO501_10555 [Mycobacterium gordonae]|uniref:Uncharacterized protein n=2 Tax=Mycobacterium TaxID=1763 RepID=A0A0Q2QXG8_MYCGO|nr:MULTISPECIES: hypothetical protein [Mycobacterium]KQH76622.1 hypothetical protein AO501_10555 [Mycobacterium gordonae]MDP7732659.1 hypothetical protein [Mycobacterium sp. TY813]
MTTSAKPNHLTPAATITHSIVTVKGQQHAEVSAHHARTPDARISLACAGIHMIFYSCHAVQGLLEAFTAARTQMLGIPHHIPTLRRDPHEIEARVALSVEWTRRPTYAVVTQSALNRFKTANVNWIDLYTGPLTWQLRDQAGLLSMIELLRRTHQTAIAIFADGQQYDADPTSCDYRIA